MITLGVLGKPFGYKGEIHFYPYNVHTHCLHAGLELFFSQDQQNLRSVILETYKKKHDGFILKFKNYDAKETVSQLTHSFLAIAKEHLPPLKEDEYYVEELIGMSVFEMEREQNVGVIEKVSFNQAEQTIIHVQTPNHATWEILVYPFVKKVDLKLRRCYIILPDYEE